MRQHRLDVSIVTPRVDRSTGGTERAVSLLLDGLRGRCRVDLYAASIKDLPSDGIRCHVLPWIPRPAPVRYLSFLLASTVEALFGSMRRRRRIVNSTSGDCLFADVVTAHFCLAEWLRIVREETEKRPMNGPMDVLRRLSYLGFWNVACLFERLQYRMPTLGAVIAVSEGLKENIVRHYGVDESMIHVIPNAVDPATRLAGEQKLRARARVRRKHSLGETDIVALFVGGNWERKGLAVVLRALAARALGRVKLLVVGSGDVGYYGRLARQVGVSDRVIFAGRTDHVEEYYAAGDLLGFPSAYESCGLVIFEAAANGLPIVSTPVYGAQQLLADGHNGYLVERTPEDVARKMQLLIRDPVRMRAMGENARKSSKRYSVDALAERTLKVFDKVYRQKYAAGTDGPDRRV